VLGSNRVLLRDDNLPDLRGERLVRGLDRRIERLNVLLDARPGLLNLVCGPGDHLTEVMGVSMIVEGFVVEAQPLVCRVTRTFLTRAPSLELPFNRALRVAKRPDSSTSSTLPGTRVNR
jgi:hypothetical protein